MNFAGVKSITIPEGDVRSIAIGGVTVWQKPNPLPYDALVEYVESDGTQWIDSGILPASDLEISTAFRFVDPWVAYAAVFGSYGTSDASTGVAIRTRGSSAQGLNIVYNVSTPVAVSGDITLTMRRGSFSVNGTDYTQSPTAQTYGPTTLTIFNSALGSNHILSVAPNVRLYSLSISKSGALARDLVPVRVGTAGYLYDRANPTGGPSGNGLYGSATGTPLVAGPDENGG